MTKKKGTQTVNGYTYYKQYYNGHTYYGKTQEELAEKIEKAKLTPGTGIAEKPTITIKKYAEQWLDGVKDSGIANSTYEFYSYGVKAVTDRIGNIKLIDSTPALLENCISDFAHTKSSRTKNYPSQKYINLLKTVLKLIYAKAKKEMIFNFNYAEDVQVKSISKRKGTEHRALDEEEINNILNFKHPLRPYCLFMLLCGLMPEEVIPLTWGDIKYDKQADMYTVTVCKTAELLSTSPTPAIRKDTTKTEYRKRTNYIPYPLSDWVKKEIKRHNKRDLIFTNKNDEILSKSAIQHRWGAYLRAMDIWANYKKNLYDPTKTAEDKKLTIAPFKQYDLRHTYCQLLVDLDIPVRKTTALMGHAESATTDKYYIDFKRINTTAEIKKLGDKVREINKIS